MRVGAHLSTKGDLASVGVPAKNLGCEVIQIFTRSPQMWAAKPLTDEGISRFKEATKESGVEDVYIHAPYLINLASANPRTRHGSVSILRDELERGTQLGAKAVMFHPGSAKDISQEEGVQAVIAGLNRIMDGYDGTCQLLVEISAGAGAVMGDTLEEIAAFLSGAERGKDIGVCFDTQHAFASGYDYTTKDGHQALIKTIKDTIGFKNLIASHVNDSKTPMGSHKDRHENIGLGAIGSDALAAFLKTPELSHLDLLLETPYDLSGDDGERPREIAWLKSLRG